MNVFVICTIILCFVVSISIYLYLYFALRKCMPGSSMVNKISCLIAHIPGSDRSPVPHIVGGVFLSLGLSLLIGYGIYHQALMKTTVNYAQAQGTPLTASGLIFGVIVSCISFWTLAQTKKIEQSLGTEIRGFEELTKDMTGALSELLDEYRSLRRGDHDIDNYCFYFVTTNPFFGMLTNPGGVIEAGFRQQLRNAAEAAGTTNESGSSFGFNIICGDTETMNYFHALYVEKQERKLSGNKNISEQQLLENIKEKAKKTTIEAEKHLADCCRYSEHKGVYRAREIPDIQFAIIGNITYEFILRTNDSRTVVDRARKINDDIMRGRFIKMFDMYRRYICSEGSKEL